MKNWVVIRDCSWSDPGVYEEDLSRKEAKKLADKLNDEEEDSMSVNYYAKRIRLW